MNKQQKDFHFKIKSFDEAQGTFEGYGNVFNFTDYANDNTQKGAFNKTLEEHKINDTMPALLWQHKMDTPIGIYTEMFEDDYGLYVKGELNLETQAGREAHALLKQGAIKGLSIGYIVVSERFNSQKNHNELLEVKLLECSLVTIPCNSLSNVETVKSLFDADSLPSERQLEKALRELGLSRKQSKAFIAEGYKAFITDDEEVEEKETTESDVEDKADENEEQAEVTEDETETTEASTDADEDETKAQELELEMKRTAELLSRLNKG